MSIVAVIPLRALDLLDPSGQPAIMISGKPLWDVTISQAMASESLSVIVIAYDDDAFLPYLQYDSTRLVRLKRPVELGAESITTIDVTCWAVQELISQGQHYAHAMLLEVTHPLRPVGIIDTIAEAIRKSSADSLITCHPVRYNYWRQYHGDIPNRLLGACEDSDVSMFQEMIGIGSVFSARCLVTQNPLGDRVDIVPIDRFWATIDVRDADGLWLAQAYLDRLHCVV